MLIPSTQDVVHVYQDLSEGKAAGVDEGYLESLFQLVMKLDWVQKVFLKYSLE
jgi:hypothetical protein